MPSARIAPTPMVEIIYRVQDIPESTNFNVNIGRIRVNSNAEEEDDVVSRSMRNIATRVVSGLRCLCGSTAIA